MILRSCGDAEHCNDAEAGRHEESEEDGDALLARPVSISCCARVRWHSAEVASSIGAG